MILSKSFLQMLFFTSSIILCGCTKKVELGSALQKMLVTISPLPSCTHATSTDGHRSLVVCLYILALSASCSPPIPLLIYVLMLANHRLYFVVFYMTILRVQMTHI